MTATESEPAAIIAVNMASPLALAFAAAYPERISCLILLSPELEPDRRLGIQRALGEFSPDSARQGMQHLLNPLNKPENEEPIRAAFEENVRRWDQLGLTDRMRHEVQPNGIEDLLQQIRCPTLVVHYPDRVLSDGINTAERIPGARLVMRDGSGGPFLNPDLEGLCDLVRTYVFEHAEGLTSVPSNSFPAGLRTLLFTDLESSTALTQQLGDAKAQEVLRGHNEAVRQALTDHGGEEVKHTGDGIFAAFGSAVSAVEAALQIQRDLAGGEVRVRIGLNAGEPIQEDDDYFGSAVQLAARVCDRAEPGQVLVPSVVRDLCRGKTFTFADQGEATLKGFPEPVRLFVVGRGSDGRARHSLRPDQ